MKMKIFYFSVIIFIIYIDSVLCVSNTTFESMKDGILQFNKAGNEFFKLIISKLDQNKTNINDFKNFNFTLAQFMKIANTYLGYSILFIVGALFAVVIPLVGLIILCCRCWSRCNSNVKVMDPRYAKYKRITYAFILSILTTAMLFGTIISLFNNQIVHETIINEDKSINIFEALKSDFRIINLEFNIIKENIDKSVSLKVDPRLLQALSNKLIDNIRIFYAQLSQDVHVGELLKITKSLEKDLYSLKFLKYQIFVQNLNDNLSKLRINLTSIKSVINNNLDSCTSSECNVVKNKTKDLELKPLDQILLDDINNRLDQLKNFTFSGIIRELKTDDHAVDMKFELDNILRDLNAMINNANFVGIVKQEINLLVNEILNLEKFVEKSIPSIEPQNSTQYQHYQKIKTFESYRFYGYLVMCSLLLVIIICYYMGLLFGIFGKRPLDDVNCCNRGVGARFLISAVVITFLVFSIFMTCVIANMLTSGVVHTELCRHTTLEKESDGKLLDFYLSIAFNGSSGIMDATLNKCYNQSFYDVFSENNEKLISKYLESFFMDFDKKIILKVSRQKIVTEFLQTRSYNSTLENIHNVNSIRLLENDVDLLNYIEKLQRMTNLEKDVKDLQIICGKVLQLRKDFDQVIQNLNNSENKYERWKMLVKSYNNNTERILESKLPDFISSVRQSYFVVINGIFSEMFKSVSCKKLRFGVNKLLRTFCEDFINPLNGAWYGIGFVLLLVIPSLFFSCLLIGLYRRIQRFYPDKEEPDYDNYIGFYARADNKVFMNNNFAKKSAHRGYKPIPLHSM